MTRRLFRPVLGLASLVAVAVAGTQLYRLTAAQELWGWWPLPLLLGLWGIIVALRQASARLDLLALSSASGLALGLGFTTLPTWPLQALGFAGLLYLTDALARRDLRLRQQWWYGYNALVLYNVVATWWVANTALAAGVVANFLNALLMAVPWAVAFLVRRYMPKIWLAAAVTLWLGFEYLHYNWQIAWPWLALGNSLGSTASFVQWFEYTGLFGGSLYLAVAGVLTYRVADLRRSGSPTRQASFATLAWLVVPMIASLIVGAQHERRLAAALAESPPPGVTVTAVQPNLEPHYVKFSLDDRSQRQRFYSLLNAAPASDLYVLPETSFSGADEATVARHPFLREWIAFRQNTAPDADLLVGLSSYRRYGSAVDDPALRTRPDGRGGELYYTAHNTALAVRAEGGAFQVYHKRKLVPGVEFLPYRGALFFFEPLVDALGGTTSGLGVSERPVVFRYGFGGGADSGLAVAPLICYESVYGDYVREFVLGGANLLAVITNDGWWDDSPGYRQHLQMAKLRAIENRRFLVQAANSGTTAFVNSSGEVLAATDYDESATLTREVLLLGDGFRTLYTELGDLIGRVAAGASGLILLSLIAAVAGSKQGIRPQPTAPER